MRIIGIDPGTAKTGYAVVEYEKDHHSNKMPPRLIECSCINTAAGQDMHKRLLQLHNNLHDIVSAHSPTIMVVEKLFFNTNVKTAMSVGQARGVPLLVAASHDVEIFEYTALQAKRVLSGYGRASKKEMQTAVKDIMGLSEIIKPDDANDALAMALCFISKDYEKVIKK